MNFRATRSCVLITAVLLSSCKTRGRFFQILKGQVQHPCYVLKMKCLPQALDWKLVALLGLSLAFSHGAFKVELDTVWPSAPAMGLSFLSHSEIAGLATGCSNYRQSSRGHASFIMTLGIQRNPSSFRLLPTK